MYPPVEKFISDENRQEPRRLFVLNEDSERLTRVSARVLEIYAEVTGAIIDEHKISEYSRRQIPKALNDFDGVFEFRFGMPKLNEPARTHGKLWGKKGSLRTSNIDVPTIGFFVDTNDVFSYDEVQPAESRELSQEFDEAIRNLADNEFSEISLPTPRRAIGRWRYDPSR